jgi:hypothetical protein
MIRHCDCVFHPHLLAEATHTTPENRSPWSKEISAVNQNRETQPVTRAAAQLSVVVLDKGMASAHLVNLSITIMM